MNNINSPNEKYDLKGAGILALDISAHKIAAIVGTYQQKKAQVHGAHISYKPAGFENGHVKDFDLALSSLKQLISRTQYFSALPLKYAVCNVSRADLQEYSWLIPGKTEIEKESKIIAYEHLLARLQLEVLGFMPDTLALADVLIQPEQLSETVLILDGGYSLTQGAIIENGKVVKTFAVPIGGRHITHDIAYGLSMEEVSAEGIKIKSNFKIKEAIIGESEQFIREIMDARLQEICREISKKLDNIPFPPDKNIILTGGLSRTADYKDYLQRTIGGEIICRYYPVAETHLTIGSDWELLPAALLYALRKHPAVILQSAIPIEIARSEAPPTSITKAEEAVLEAEENNNPDSDQPADKEFSFAHLDKLLVNKENMLAKPLITAAKEPLSWSQQLVQAIEGIF